MRQGNIVLAVSINDFSIGGAQRLLADLFREKEFEKYEIHLITFFDLPHKGNLYDTLHPSVTVHRLNVQGLLDIRGWARTWKVLGLISPDLVLSNLYVSNTYMRVIAFFRGIPVVAVEHNTYTGKNFLQHLIDWLLSHATTAIVAVSQDVRTFLVKTQHISESRIKVITNGISLASIQSYKNLVGVSDARRMFDVGSDELVILFVGRLVPQKDPILALEGVKKFAETYGKPVLFCVVGDGELRNTMEQSAKGAAMRTIFAGETDPNPYYRAADFFISTSLIEGYGLVRAEALAFGVPVISTSTGGSDTLMQDGVNGVVLEDREPRAVADGIQRAITLGREALSQNAHKLVMPHSIERTATQYGDLIEAIAEGELDVRDIRRVIMPTLRLIGTQHWLRLGIRYRLLNPFHALVTRPYSFTVTFFGLKYTGTTKSHIDQQVYLYGSYERYMLKLLADIAKESPDPVFVDVGANVGHHTLFMSTRVSRVHAFEPYDPVRDLLYKALRDNEVTNVTVHHVGLANKDAFLEFNAPQGQNLGVGSFSTETGRDDVAEVGKLPVREADTYFQEQRISGVDVIKIDVEGFETHVLKGMRNVLEKDRPWVVMEFSSATKISVGDKETFLSLFPEKYQAYTIARDVPWLLLFNHDGYQLRPFDFDYTKGNILLAPNEKISKSLLQYSA